MGFIRSAPGPLAAVIEMMNKRTFPANPMLVTMGGLL